MRALLVVVVAGLALAGCGEAGDPGDQPAAPLPSTGDPGGGAADVEILTVAKGADGPRQAGQVVARSAADWQEAWARHGGPGSAPSLPPEVDFARQVVVAVFQGQRPSAGHEVIIESVRDRAGGLEVGYASVAPGPDCFTASVITFPFHVVAVAGAGEEATFSAEERAKPCGP